MAKVRIFELARDLNMQSKQLMEKLDEMGIPAKSHMSSISDEAVVAVKANLTGKKVDVVEETRVKSTVIRRRKKIVRKKTVPPEAIEEPEAPTEAETDDTEVKEPS